MKLSFIEKLFFLDIIYCIIVVFSTIPNIFKWKELPGYIYRICILFVFFYSLIRAFINIYYLIIKKNSDSKKDSVHLVFEKKVPVLSGVKIIKPLTVIITRTLSASIYFIAFILFIVLIVQGTYSILYILCLVFAIINLITIIVELYTMLIKRTKGELVSKMIENILEPGNEIKRVICNGTGRYWVANYKGRHGDLLDPMSHRYTMRVLLDNSETIELYGDEFDFENK